MLFISFKSYFYDLSHINRGEIRFILYQSGQCDLNDCRYKQIYILQYGRLVDQSVRLVKTMRKKSTVNLKNSLINKVFIE